MSVIYPPEHETIQNKAAEYVAALGRVAFSWNRLQELLGQLFAAAIPMASHHVILAVWYSEQSDRNQRRLLRAAVNAGALSGWPSKLPDTANDDILWLLKAADELSGRRDEAIHAPAAITTDEKGTEMTAAFYFGNPLAMRLKGKDLVYEFSLSQWRAEQLSHYAGRIVDALTRHTCAWPDTRPGLSREFYREFVETGRRQY